MAPHTQSWKALQETVTSEQFWLILKLDQMCFEIKNIRIIYEIYINSKRT